MVLACSACGAVSAVARTVKLPSAPPICWAAPTSAFGSTALIARSTASETSLWVRIWPVLVLTGTLKEVPPANSMPRWNRLIAKLPIESSTRTAAIENHSLRRPTMLMFASPW